MGKPVLTPESLSEYHQFKIYLLNVHQVQEHYSECIERITPARRYSALRFQSKQEQLNHIAAGYLLYKVLNINGEDQVERTAFGKPYLKSGNPFFSLSHSGNYAVLAVSDSDIGVDIEYIREFYNIDYSARKSFTQDELLWVQEENEQCERFFIVWTRKEAILKVDGRGFDLDPKSISSKNPRGFFVEHFIFDRHVVACAMRKPFIIDINIVCLRK
jgi:4'-phosphopantetheinyl transferase